MAMSLSGNANMCTAREIGPLSADGEGDDDEEAEEAPAPLKREPSESDEQFAWRVRKQNYLNLAQEYVSRTSESRLGRRPKSCNYRPVKSLPSYPNPPSILETSDCSSDLTVEHLARMEEESRQLNKLTSTSEDYVADVGDSDSLKHAVDVAQKEHQKKAESPIHPADNRRVPEIPQSRKEVLSDSQLGNVALGIPSLRYSPGKRSSSVVGVPAGHLHRQSWDSSSLRVNRTVSSQRLGRKSVSPELSASFDVYNMETAMPAIDWLSMEEQLARAALDHRKSYRTDREEIRRRLATGSDVDDFSPSGKKPSLQARLQSGMNLQICFMNETASDGESTTNDQELDDSGNDVSQASTDYETVERPAAFAPALSSPHASSSLSVTHCPIGPVDFQTRQAQLQAEARLALAQAKHMARMQVQVERSRKKSPIAEMVGLPFPDGRRKLTSHQLGEMNVAQLQVIVNDLHSQIESLNEELVRLLLTRDDLHMEQDSMLVDIEDQTRYLGAKEQAHREEGKHDIQILGNIRPKFQRNQ